MSTVTITVHDAEALDGMPDETLIRASGRYLAGGTFTDCWARPVPRHITGDEGARLWEVLAFGSADAVTAEHITYPVEVLYVDVEDQR